MSQPLFFTVIWWLTVCGVIGIIGPDSPSRKPHWAAYESYRALLTLQHRGQDAAGILTYSDYNKKFFHQKDFGLVTKVFDERKIRSLLGNSAVAHIRYPTVGARGSVEDLQPMVTGLPLGVGMVHNGNLVNYHQLARKLNQDMGSQLLTENDLEVLLHLWCRHITASMGSPPQKVTFSNMLKAGAGIMSEAKGAYALCGLMPGVGLFAIRDPKGIRPLVLGRRKLPTGGEYDYCLSSETQALNFLDFEYVRDIAPGEVILIDNEGKIQSAIASKEEDRASYPCMFEWVYFAAAESSIAGRSVYGTRLKLGQLLAQKVRRLMETGIIDPDIVCPVPDTSRTAGIALAESLGINYREGLIKNRYIHRSFILKDQSEREKALEIKLSPVRSEIDGKNILLVDDSIVRGTTCKKIISLLKRYGAKEITLVVTCPPIRHGCYYGIDFPSPTELLANGRDVEEMADHTGANRVIYLEEEDMHRAIELENMCMACVNGRYPTSVEGADEFTHQRCIERERV